MAVKGIAIDNIESVISNFDRRQQKRVIRYLIRRLRRLRKNIKRG